MEASAAIEGKGTDVQIEIDPEKRGNLKYLFQLVDIRDGRRSPPLHCSVQEYCVVLRELIGSGDEIVDNLGVFVLMDEIKGQMEFSNLPFLKVSTFLFLNEVN